MNAVNPGLWWLLLLALAPILIHILIRRRLPVVRWSAMTFLLKALRRNRRRLLLETILLLVVRTALILVLALVLIRPLFASRSVWTGGQGSMVTAVIVLDDSAGMAASDGVQTRFARAVTRVEQYLEDLSGGSEVMVLLGAEPPQPLFRRATRDFESVIRKLRTLEPRDSADALPAAIRTATAWLGAEEGRQLEILVVTDAQAASVDASAADFAEALEAAHSLAAIFVAPVHPTPESNLAVDGLTISGGPRGLVPGLTTTLWPSRIQARVRGMGLREETETTVNLFVDGRKVGSRRVVLPPDAPATVDFEHRFIKTGETVVGVECETDLYSRDNTFTAVADVVDRYPVLVVDGKEAAERFATASGYLRVALWPEDSGAPGSVSPFDLDVMSPAEVDLADLSRYALIIMTDVRALPSTAALERIKNAVHSGAGLWVIAGTEVTERQLAGMWTGGGEGPLPVAFGERFRTPDGEPTLTLELTQPLKPVLDIFDDPSLLTPLTQAGFRTAIPVTDILGGEGEVWARTSDGRSLLVGNRFGRGRVAYFGAPVDRAGGVFPLSPAFVPFVQQIAFHLIGGGAAPPITAGAPLVWPQESDEATLLYPDGSSEPADRFLNPARALVVLDAAPQQGVYGLRDRGPGGVQVMRRQAVRAAAVESDLRTIPADELERRPAFARATLIGPDAPLAARIRAARTGGDFAFGGLLLLIVLLAMELILVRLFNPKPVDSRVMLSKAMRLG